MTYTWNPLYKVWIGQDGIMYTTKEKEVAELREAEIRDESSK